MDGRDMRRSHTLSDDPSDQIPKLPAGDDSAAMARSSNLRSLTLGSTTTVPSPDKRDAFASRAGSTSSRMLLHLRPVIPDGDELAKGLPLPTSPVFGRTVTNRRNEGRLARSNSGGRDALVPDYTTAAAVAGAAEGGGGGGAAPPVEQPVMSLMALLGGMDEDEDEDEDEDDEEEVDEEDEDDGRYHVCCVCMVRHKGPAFVPCGHTFCRLCSRELWVSRGNCPLCNGYILEILDIF